MDTEALHYRALIRRNDPGGCSREVSNLRIIDDELWDAVAVVHRAEDGLQVEFVGEIVKMV